LVRGALLRSNPTFHFHAEQCSALRDRRKLYHYLFLHTVAIDQISEHNSAFYFPRGVVHFWAMQLTRKKVDWWCERGMVWLVLGMLVFAPLAFGAVDAWAWLGLQAAGGVIFTLWAARLWLSRRIKIFWPPLAWVAAAFGIYAVSRYFTADIEYVARLELLQVLFFIFIFFCVVTNLRGQEETEAVSGVLIGVGTFAACYAVLQMLTHSARVWNQISPGGGERGSGTYISPNHLADLLGMLLPLALAFLLVGRMRVLTRIVVGYAVVAMAAGLAVTFSRGGWVAAACGILVVPGILLFHANHRMRALVLLAAMLLGGTFFVHSYLSHTDAYTHRVHNPDRTAPSVIDTSSRAEMWQAAVQMWRDHFWFGVGPAHYDYRFREYRPVAFEQRPGRAHNDYLNLLADWGAVGGLIVFAGGILFLFQLRQTWPHVRRQENAFGSGQSNRFAFFLGGMAGLMSLAVHSLVDFSLHIPANALVAVVLLALLTSNLRFATDQHWVRPRNALKIFATVLLVGVTVYFAAQEWRLAREARWLAVAERHPLFSTPRATALGNAFVCEPKNFSTSYEIGECFRMQSFDGGNDYGALATNAMLWYAAAMKLNPHDGYNFLRTGMCLDWLGATNQSEAMFFAAEARDPNGYYLVANIGWHYIQAGDYATARQWFLRSLKLYGNNPIATSYLRICDAWLAKQAAGKPAD
jgi:O-antigen ligase